MQKINVLNSQSGILYCLIYIYHVCNLFRNVEDLTVYKCMFLGLY